MTESLESSIGLEQCLPILKRHWLPASNVFVLVFSTVTLAAFLQEPIYEAAGNILIKRQDSTPSIVGLGEEIGQLRSLDRDSSPLETEAQMIVSAPMLEKTIAVLNPEYQDIHGSGLRVIKVGETDMLQISYQDTDPQKTAAVVNALMDVYIENNILLNRTSATAAREFIEKQLPQAEARVNRVEAALRNFKEVNQLIDADQAASSTAAVIEGLQQQITAVESQLANINAESESLRNKLNKNSEEAMDVTSLNQSPGVQQLLQQLQQAESQLALKRTLLTETNPEIASLESQVAALKSQLQGRVGQVLGEPKQVPTGNLQLGGLQQELSKQLVTLETRRQGLTGQITALSKEQSDYRQRLAIMPMLEQKQRELERKLQAAQSSYSQLLQRLEEIKIAENINIGNAHIISSAVVPTKPVAPRKSLYMAAGIIVGGMLAMGTALVLEARDKSIRTVDEARALFGSPLLGVIPLFEKSLKTRFLNRNPEESNLEVVVRDRPRSSVSESYRMLQTNLKFLSSDKKIKTIVVTSSVPQEGKSTVAANLAMAMAQTGRKVLLVDGDMRRPRQHYVSNLPNQVGLSNVLVGDIEFQAGLKKVIDNLYVLTAGVVPPNPMALLDSQRMVSLIEQFSADYDFTIIDTPPLIAAADASVLGQMADGVLLVVRPEMVDSASATFAKEILEQAGQNVLGMVVNGVVPNNEPHSYYYFAQEYYGETATVVPEVVPEVVPDRGRSS